MKILITGTAGFIGSHLAERLAKRGDDVIGLDNINDYYDKRLKYGRLQKAGVLEKIECDNNIDYNTVLQSSKYQNYKFIKLELEDKEKLLQLFETEKFDAVCNLAAQAGVRYSLENPDAYIKSNVVGFMNILECCRQRGVNKLAYASSSSVYGSNKKLPFSVEDNVDHPISLYAASKKANELMAHTYTHLYGIATTGLRFFTVYGPWGRPDMALFLFTKAAIEGKPIDVYNNGDMRRDFTYIDDIIEGVVRIIDQLENSGPEYRLYNIGNNRPVYLMDFINVIEKKLGKEIEKNYLPMQAGDVKETFADVSALIQDVGYKPNTTIEEGIDRFIEWYKQYYNING